MYSWEGPRCSWDTGTAGTWNTLQFHLWVLLLFACWYHFFRSSYSFFGLLGAASWHVSRLVALRERKQSDTLDMATTQPRTVYNWGGGWGGTDETIGSLFCVSGSFLERRGMGQTKQETTYVSTRNEGQTLEVLP